MSNLNTRGVVDFATAERFLDGRSSATLCFATTVFRESPDSIVVQHHRTEIIRYCRDGQVDIRNGGYLTPTTTDRLHRMTPIDVRVSRAKGGWIEAPATGRLDFVPSDWVTVVA